MKPSEGEGIVRNSISQSFYHTVRLIKLLTFKVGSKEKNWESRVCIVLRSGFGTLMLDIT